MSVASARVPVILVCGIICLLLGIAGGIVLGAFVETPLNKRAAAEGAETADAGMTKAGAAGAPGGGGKGGAPGGKGGDKAGGGKGKGGFTPSPKTQLAQLVVKLDALTKKPLAVELTPEQKKQVKELLADLDAKDALSDDDAKAKFEALLKLVAGQRDTLEAAGYRWPGTLPGAPPGEPPPNPFKEGDPANRLKSLRESMAK